MDFTRSGNKFFGLSCEGILKRIVHSESMGIDYFWYQVSAKSAGRICAQAGLWKAVDLSAISSVQNV